MKNIFTILLLSAGAYCMAQNTPAWVRYSTPSNYENYDVREVSTGTDSIGNIYTSASMYDSINNLSKIMLVKYNTLGTQQWMQLYDYNNSTYNGSYAVTLLIDKAGNSYVCGYGRGTTTNGKDFMVLKYNNAGTQLWAKYWDGGQSLSDYITCATFDKSGNIVVAGYANTMGTTWDDLAVVKYSTAGTQLWSYTYNNAPVNGEDRALGIASDASDNIYVTGSSYGTVSRDMITLKLNSSGTNQWVKRMAHGTSSDDDRGYSIAADAVGNSYVTGAVNDWITVKYDPSGNVLWTNSYTANDLNRYSVKKVMLDKANNVIVGTDVFVSSNQHFSDLGIVKLNNATGASIWATTFNNSGIDTFEDFVLDTMGNIYVAGAYDGPIGKDMSTMILSPAGIILWNTTFSNALNTRGGDMPYQIATDNNRNVILAGVSETRGSGSGSNVDVVTLKFGTQGITGIQTTENKAAHLNVYPNPAKNYVTLSVSDESFNHASITLYNMLGDVLVKDVLNTQEQSIDLGNLAKGVYVLTIQGAKETLSKKLVVE
ncbi:MAG: T9SS type A sorting domain-containing protein [Bacteroidota bacterium]